MTSLPPPNAIQTTPTKNTGKATSTATFDESELQASPTSGPYDAYSNKEIERYVENSFERAKIEVRVPNIFRVEIFVLV